MATHKFKLNIVNNTITFLVPQELIGKKVLITITDELKTVVVNELKIKKIRTINPYNFKAFIDTVVSLNLKRGADEDVADELPSWYKEDNEKTEDIDINEI